MSTKKVRLRITGDVGELLESRGIRDEDLKEVIQTAEEQGEKLYMEGENRFLAKLRIEGATFYAEYSKGKRNTYVIHTAYAHRSNWEE